MRVIVPFDPSDPNTRLSSLLSPAERREFATAMLRDVLAAVREAGGQPTVLSTTTLDEAPTSRDDSPTNRDEAPTGRDENGDASSVVADVPVTVDDRPLSTAVNDAIAEELPAAVVMADLALATPTALSRLFATEGDVVIAPGRGGGTNALVVRHPDFAVDYHGVSFADHVDAAEAVGASVSTVDSFRLGVDVDEPADVLDLLVHGDGAAAAWLRDAGFRVAVEDGDPTVVRED
jgi:2-phospho-L-lactate guanylyltransferase